MRIKKMLCLVGSAAALLLPGCASDTADDIAAGKGKIVLQVGIDGNVTDVVPATRASQASVVPQASELNIRLAKADGSYAESWGSIEEFPKDKEFPQGAYSLEVFYGSPEFEGFEKPYYYGVSDVAVEDGKVSEASVTATLANCMVSIDYTDAFKSFFAEYSTQTHVEGGDYISFMSDETRPAYMRTGKTTVTVSVTKQNGLSASIEAADFEADARHHYHITLDVNNGQTGQGEIVVKFDDSIVTEDVTIDVSDQAMLTPAPVVTPSGFVHNSPVAADEYAPMNTTQMTVNAPAGISKVTLTCQSPYLQSKGFPSEIELMSMTEAQRALLESFGLQLVGFKKTDKFAVIDFSNVTEHISGTGSHTFTVVTKDKYSKVNDPVTLMINTRTVNTHIISVPDIFIDDTQTVMNVNSDAANFANCKVGVQVENEGVWSSVPFKLTDKGEGNYALSFNVPDEAQDYPVRLTISGNVVGSATLHKVGVAVSANEADVWATHADVSIRKNVNTPLSELSFFVSTDGNTYSRVNATANVDGTVTVNGLTPGTKYYIKGTDNGELANSLNTLSVSTETALQPQNGNMDSWGKDSGWSKKSAWVGNTIYKYWPGLADNEYWATRNNLTTCKDFGATSCWYNCYSGTYDAAGINGTKCAEICTVGWSRNQLNSWVDDNPKYTSAGYLFMGTHTYIHSTDTETFSYGRPFASRPAGLKFMYKFKSVNSESFKAYVVVENRNNGKVTELGRGEIVSNQDKTAFTQATVKINYTNKKLKATHAYVVFVSSTADNPTTVKVQGSIGTFQGYSDSRYTGNVLNVDNIEFTY
ncbi:MAG: DUF4493 domain-containing protein [Prevotella sp.]|nr:DUF4493 domain-containing protein [Prevotella sp.]MCM1074826.1 DUF4493 domain-containing protein [Ruminococcus sp.]